jgi:hypothetical protein
LFHRNSIFLDLVFELNFKILFQNIPNPEFKLIRSKSLTKFQFSIFEKVQTLSIKLKFHLIYPFQLLENSKPNSYSFLQFRPMRIWQPTPVLPKICKWNSGHSAFWARPAQLPPIFLVGTECKPPPPPPARSARPHPLASGHLLCFEAND